MRLPEPGSGHRLRAALVAAIVSLSATAAAAAPVGEVDATLDPRADAALDLRAGKGPAEPAAPATGRKVAPAAPAGLFAKVHDRTSSMVVAALNFIDVRYRAGGDSADAGFDCSGFTRHVVATSLGLLLPRSADEQAAAPGLVAVRREDLQPGDLVFFNTLRRTFSHVGIYIGENRFIHAPRAGRLVRTEDMSLAYWAQRFTGARRVLAAAAGLDEAAPLAGLRSVPASH